MLRGGAPDFIALRVDDDGNIGQFMAVEVKDGRGQLTYEQQVYRKLFTLAGIPFIVETIHTKPRQPILGQATPSHAIPDQTNHSISQRDKQ